MPSRDRTAESRRYRENRRLKTLALTHRGTEAAKRNTRPKREAPATEPACTPALAYEFVKLLHAGIPLDDAIRRVGGRYYIELHHRERKRWLTKWAGSPAVADAQAKFCRSEWQELGRDERLQIALDKHCAEMAYFLFTHEYASLDGPDLVKAKDARVTLMEMLKVNGGGDEGPFAAMVKELLAKAAGGTIDGPPVLGVLPAPPTKVVVES